MFNADARRDYARSNETVRIDIKVNPEIATSAGRIRRALSARDPALVMAATLSFVGQLCDAAKMPRVPVRIAPRRKRAGRSEFYGWCGPKYITVYLRTAERGRFIAFRTLLKMLCHEFGHHHDWKALQLTSSFHTKGFTARVGELYRSILDAMENQETA
jgi:hypothetical protein